MKFYLDTCIWLNLFKKEGDSTKGIPYWEITERFIKWAKDDEIVVSTIVLKELFFRIPNKFKIIKSFFENTHWIFFVKTCPEDYKFARELELEFKIGFYDCLHVAICRRLNYILVTRDKAMINVAKKYVNVNKPENLIC